MDAAFAAQEKKLILRNDCDGMLLFDKKTGINMLFDEVKVCKPDIAPRHISIALTNRCNMSCENCYITHGNIDLEINRIINWVKELENTGCLSIGLGGGEPTLWNDLEHLLTFINTTQMAVTLTSNGSADSNLYKWIAKKVNLLRFSIDGLSTTYEKRRNQNYSEFVNKICDIREYGNIGLNYLLTEDTVDQLDDFVDVIRKVKPSEILLIPYLDTSGNILLSECALKNVNTWIETYNGKLPICCSYSALEFVSSSILPVQSINSNTQYRYFCHINVKGQLMRNVFDKNPIAINGSLIEALSILGGKHENLERVWN